MAKTMTLIAIAGEYRIFRTHSVYPVTVVAKMHDTFMAFCYKERYFGGGSIHKQIDSTIEDIYYRAENKSLYPDEHINTEYAKDILKIGYTIVGNQEVEIPIWFPESICM